AGGADLVDLYEDRVAVAVQRDRLDPLLVAGGLALHPVLLAAARPVGAAPGGEGAVQGLVVHPAEHEHLAGVVLLGDGGHEAVGVALQPIGDLGVQVGRSRVGHGPKSIAGPRGAGRREPPPPAGARGGRDTRDTKGPASRREGGPFTYDYRLPVLQGDDLVSLRTPVTLRHLELDALVLVQRAVAGGLDGRVVHEDVRPAAVDGDESEALLGVEPLHGALLGHVFLLAAKPGPTPRGPVRSLRYALAPRYGPGKAKTPAAISPRASGRTIENHDCNRRPHRITASA